MTYAEAIINAAGRWYARGCRETSQNRGPCVDDIHERFSAAWIRDKRSEAWCAKFVWIVCEEAARTFGVKTVLPHTAGALDMLNRSKASGVLRVDTAPAVGSVFYRRSGARGASGHVGIVHALKPLGAVQTIEGNIDDNVAYHAYTRKEQLETGMKFIHIEETIGAGAQAPALLAGMPPLTTLLMVGAAIGALYFYKQGQK